MRATATHPLLPLPDEQIYAPYKISALVELLAEQGISADDSLRGSGVDPDALKDPFALTSMRQFMTVCMNALTLPRDPATPFSWARGCGFRLTACMAMRCCPA